MRAASALCLFIVTDSALAQTMPTDPSDDIVVTATRTPQFAGDIAAGVTVIDRATIEQRGYTTLADALSAVPGLRVAQSGGPGAQASVFVRGTNSNQVLVLIDGVPVNDPGDPGNAFNFGVDTLGDVERIEIVRGPLSTLYGSGAIGGVINIITRHGRGAPHGSVTLGGGVPRQGLAQADIAGGNGPWDYAASYEAQSLLGFDQTPKREYLVYTGERDGDRNQQGQVEIGLTPVQGTRLSLLVRARDNTFGYDEQGFVTFDGNNATGYDASLFCRLGLTSQLFDGAWQTSAYLSGLQDDRRYTVAYDPFDPNNDTADNRYHGRRADFQWNNTVQLPDWWRSTHTQFTFGYEHVADQADVKINSLSGGYPYDSAVRAHDDSDAGWAGLQSTLFGRLVADAQLREEATTVAGNAFTWRVGGTFSLNEIGTRLKASYGTSFLAPSLFDRYGIDNFGYVGNPNLRPERAQGWEAGFESDLPSSLPGHGTFSVTYFNNLIRDLIEIAFAPVYTSVNVASARTQGVEVTLHWTLARYLDADLAYTYTDARALDSGARLLRRPYNQGSADLAIHPIPSVTIAPEILYTGSFADYLVNNAGETGFTPGLSPSGWLVNLNATWQAQPHLRLFVWAKNLTASRFEPVNGYQIPGASFLAGARWDF